MTTHISLSIELMCLLDWLMKHEKALLGSLIKHAIDHGFADEFENIDLDGIDNYDQLYPVVLDFLGFLEDELGKHLDGASMDQRTKEAISPALNRLDGDVLGDKTMWMSMQQAQSIIKNTPRNKAVSEDNKQAQGILFEQILKNWKPTNKDDVN